MTTTAHVRDHSGINFPNWILYSLEAYRSPSCLSKLLPPMSSSSIFSPSIFLFFRLEVCQPFSWFFKTPLTLISSNLISLEVYQKHKQKDFIDLKDIVIVNNRRNEREKREQLWLPHQRQKEGIRKKVWVTQEVHPEFFNPLFLPWTSTGMEQCLPSFGTVISKGMDEESISTASPRVSSCT